MRMMVALTAFLMITSPAWATPKQVRDCIRIAVTEGTLDNHTNGMQQDQALSLVYKIANSIAVPVKGMRTLDCQLVLNAEAYTETGDSAHGDLPSGEYIAFNSSWVRQVAGTDETQVYAILGHELGHFLGRHASRNISAHDKELEADAFGGCAVARMKGDWGELVSLLKRLRDDFPSDYPSAEESISAAAESFRACGGTLPADTLDSDVLGWIYVGIEDDGWSKSSTLTGIKGFTPEELEGNKFVLNRGVNLRDGPFKATKQLDNGGCRHKESKIIGGLAGNTSVTIEKIYRLEGDWCSHFIWAQVTPE